MATGSQPPPERLRERFRIKNILYRNALAEFVGTGLLILIGLGLHMVHVLSKEKINTHFQAQVGWGFAVAFPVYVTYHISGGQLNPSLSAALFTLGKINMKEFVVYVIAQIAGGFVGTVGVYFLYLDQLKHFQPNERSVSGLVKHADCFIPFPSAHVSNITCFFDALVGTALLVFFIIAILDKRNRVPTGIHPLLFGFVVTMTAMAYGMNAGVPINPAKDIGPRILVGMLYGNQVFSYHSYYWLVTLFGSLLGGISGAWFYLFTLGMHVPELPIVERELTEESKKLLPREA
ncbi:hypothetical protein WR25_07377 [Diploscapter pachys]|uniref:Aquaporin n=1 Tax=Diploscapter pachys TaxID=2018661 RepID=A0A2A2KSS7_9BILA|nr:hypothetical protein WR25_07377 [Diploscapter pachys]